MLDETPRRDIKILMGDTNAKVGSDNIDREEIIGKHGLGTMNENGELFADFCTFNDLVIGGSVFPHKTIHKATRVSPDGKTENQIDHITISRKWRRNLLDTRVKREEDVASDHHLLLGTVRIKLKKYADTATRPQQQYNVQKLVKRNKTRILLCCEKQV